MHEIWCLGVNIQASGRTSIEAGMDRGRGNSSRLAETLHMHPRQGKGQQNLLEFPRSSNSTVGWPLEVWHTPGVLPTPSLTLGCSPLSSQSPFLSAASRWVVVGPGWFPPVCSIADCTPWALVIWDNKCFAVCLAQRACLCAVVEGKGSQGHLLWSRRTQSRPYL